MDPRCRHARTSGIEPRRRHLAHLFQTARAGAAFAVRLALCASASQCGRLCPRLVKPPGAAGAKCVDLESQTQLDLYASLEDPSYHCPENRF